MENILGVIGGMGPMASKLFYEMVTLKTVAHKDQDHINMVILSHATMPDRTGAILSGQTEEPLKLLLEDSKTLESLGAKAICVTCNTAHYFMHQISDGKMVSTPVISMIRETAKRMGKLFPGEKVAIMATDGTVKSGLYQKALEAEGVIPYTLSEENQKNTMHLIYDCVKAGLPADKDAFAAVDAELKSSGCKAVLMACTELSVIKADEHLGDFYVDPMEVMAEVAVEFMGKELVK